MISFAIQEYSGQHIYLDKQRFHTQIYKCLGILTFMHLFTVTIAQDRPLQRLTDDRKTRWTFLRLVGSGEDYVKSRGDDWYFFL